MTKVILIILAVAAVAAGIYWVTVGSKPSVSEAQADFCGHLKDYGEAVTNLRSIDQNSTVEELKDAQKAVQESWEALQKASSMLGTAKLEALESSYAELESTIQNIPNDVTLAQAQTDIYQAALNTLANALAADQVTCRYAIVGAQSTAELP